MAMTSSNLSALSSVISVPSTLTSGPLFLALVIILSISLNLFMLTFTHFARFILFSCSHTKNLCSKN